MVIDKNLHAHKVAAYSAAFWILSHISVYTYSSSLSAAKAKIPLGQYLVSSRLGQTGLALFILYIIIFLASVPIVRRRCYEVFYYIHQLFIPCIVLMFLHHDDKTFYKYVAFPGTVYFLDRIYRVVRSFWGTPKIRTVIQHNRNVVELHIEKRRMTTNAGQFVYIMCPSVDPIQWHPFTLTSSPHEDLISVHVSGTGNWTQKFMKRLGCELDAPLHFDTSVTTSVAPHRTKSTSSKSCDDTINGNTSQLQILMQNELKNPQQPLEKPGDIVYYMDPVTRKVTKRSRKDTDSRVLHQDFNVYDLESSPAVDGPIPTPNLLTKPLPTIFVDGPYGTPTEKVFDYQVGILIGAGIGATPFTSILKYLHFCHGQSYRSGELRKVYFIWVCRELKALEWFIDVLSSLDRNNLTDYLEIRVYLTENIELDNIHNLSLHHDPHGKDSITNLRHCVTYFGRPNFKTIFNYIGKRHKNCRAGVFFCGPKSMGRMIRRESQRTNKQLKRSHKTTFDFHKENF